MSFSDLESVARSNSATTDFPGDTPLAKMLNGFQVAKAAVLSHVPAGSEITFQDAYVANQVLSEKVDQNRENIRAALSAGKDLSEATGIALTAKQLRDYVLSNYVLACAGIGSYASGFAADSVSKGVLAPEVYNDGIQTRLDVFSRIVGWEKSGDLGRVLQPEAAGQKVLNSAGAAGQSTGSIVLRSGKTGVYTATGTSGLGEPISITTAIIIVATVIVAGLVTYLVIRDKNNISAQRMKESCDTAFKYGYQDAMKACTDWASGLSDKSLVDNVFGGQVTSQLTKYLLIGGLAYLGIIMLPQITQSVMTSQEIVRKKRAEAS